jgi:Neuraminidase (sialidase)
METKFGDHKVLAKNNGSSLEPQMAVSPNNVIIAAWQDNTPYDRSQQNKTAIDILYRVSKDSGSTFANRSTIGAGRWRFCRFYTDNNYAWRATIWNE